MPTFGLYVTNPLRKEARMDYRDDMPSGRYGITVPLVEKITHGEATTTDVPPMGTP